MNIQELIKEYHNIGYNTRDAMAKVGQDIILSKISKSPYINNVTIKGGVVMHNISKDKRRVTRDIDLDFIRYSLEDNQIRNFISGLGKVKDGIKLEIVNDEIIELKQQDYKGKRLELKLIDNYDNSIVIKLDLGVHKNVNIEQEELVFSLDVLNENVVLLVNSKEQIFVEKLKSLLAFGRASTRYKDILDFYFLINETNLDKGKTYLLINDYIFLNETLEYYNVNDIYSELKEILSSNRFIRNFDNIKNNWLELPIDEVANSILNFIASLEYVGV